LFFFAALSLASGIAWLVVVFLALGIALLFFYREAVEIPEGVEPSPKQVRGQEPGQVVLVQQPSHEPLYHAIAEEIVKHEILTRARKKKH